MSVESVMDTMFNIGVPLALLAAVFGFRWREGLWGNTIAVFCVLFSIFFAIAWWETVAVLLCQAMPSILYASDMVAIWVIFLISLAILCELTRLLSRVKVLFLVPIEGVGNFVTLLVLFLLMYNFFLFTFELSPIGAKESAAEPSANSTLIKVSQLLSTGTLEAFVEPRKFDETDTLRKNHFERRRALQAMAVEKEGTIRLFYDGPIPERKR